MNKDILVAVLIFSALLVSGCENQDVPEKYTGHVENINLGVETSLLPSLVWVAENQGYFLEQGLNVNIKEFDSGKNALKTMLDQMNLDMVTVAQTPVMLNSFNRNDYKIIGGMVSSSNILGKQVSILPQNIN